MEEAKPTREELRAKLRKKINDKRENDTGSIQSSMKKDPKGTMLSMGIDDPTILNMAEKIAKNPESVLNNIKGMVSKPQPEEEEPPPL
tara:strand:- start:629 stop:892 length:264 start_codon:yes stop_codon:yes gene_type:complete